MKIAQVMVAKGFGGAERYFVDLSNHLAERGHEVLVITHKDFQGLRQLKQSSNLRVENILVLGWWDFRSRLKMQKVINNFNTEIIHSHLARATYLCGRISNSLNIPLTVKTHNYIDLKYYKNVDVFIPTTEDQKQYLINQGVDENKIEVIPNFSKISPVEEINYSQAGDKLEIYSIGRMVKKKGFDNLLRAFSTVVKSGYEARLEIAGDGPERKVLMELVEELDLGNHVKLPGWIDDVSNFAENKDVFVLPSLDEPFGIVVLEAMAMGKPIISTRTQGPREILDEQAACFVAINVEEELADAMKKFIDDKEYRLKLADNSLKRFKKKYSLEVVAPKILDLYQRLSV